MNESRPVVFLAFANNRDDRARYLRNLAEAAPRLREALAPAERAGPEATRPLSILPPRTLTTRPSSPPVMSDVN